MSCYSTIDAQHSALRDLERQRLERKIGQLRKEIEGKSTEQANGKNGLTSAKERRFQPPKRRPAAPHVESAVGPYPPPGIPPTQSCGSGRSTPRGGRRGRGGGAAGGVRGPTPEPGSGRSTPRGGGAGGRSGGGTPKPGPSEEEIASRPQSVEVAWLMRMCQRMDEEEAPPDDEEESGCSTPPSDHGPAVRSTVVKRQCTTLNMLPSGWVRVKVAEPPPAVEKIHKVVLVDSCAGDDEPLPADGAEEVGVMTPSIVAIGSGCASSEICVVEASHASRASSKHSCVQPSIQEAEPFEPTMPMEEQAVAVATSHPAVARRRPSTAVSSSSSMALQTPTWSGASMMQARRSIDGPQKVCCYECYRQVHAEHAVSVEPSRAGEVSRQFCSEACSAKFQEARVAHSQRVQELSERREQLLRASPVDAPPPPPEEEEVTTGQ